MMDDVEFRKSSFSWTDACVEVGFRKSSFSNPSGECVEVGFEDGEILVRDTKNRALPAHRYTVEEWTAFLAGVKGGEFDLPVLQG